MDKFKNLIRDIPDFPKKGIIFKDITTLLKNPRGFKDSIDSLCKPYKDSDLDVIAGIESRGFIFGGAMAVQLGTKFVPIRKKGKLPAETLQKEYALEYGTNVIEIHKDAIEKGEKVLIVDDLLATGGTVNAAIDLVRELGGSVVGAAFLIELAFLNGRDRFKGVPVLSLISYDEE
ncbi:adenine phosphoribosyltransferase [bacterium]|nr:adenine phosphoribosyltransferase [bacterium]